MCLARTGEQCEIQYTMRSIVQMVGQAAKNSERQVKEFDVYFLEIMEVFKQRKE